MGNSRDEAVAALLETILNQVLKAQATEQLNAEDYEKPRVEKITAMVQAARKLLQQTMDDFQEKAPKAMATLDVPAF